MATPLPAGLVQQAILDRLRAAHALTDRLARSSSGVPGIYDRLPQAARFPCVEVGAFVAVPQDTYGSRWDPHLGANITGQVKVLSTWPGDREAWDLQGLIAAELDYPDPALVIAGYGSVECWVEETGPPYTEELGTGLTVRHLPAVLRVLIHEL